MQKDGKLKLTGYHIPELYSRGKLTVFHYLNLIHSMFTRKIVQIYSCVCVCVCVINHSIQCSSSQNIIIIYWCIGLHLTASNWWQQWEELAQFYMQWDNSVYNKHSGHSLGGIILVMKDIGLLWSLSDLQQHLQSWKKSLEHSGIAQ